MVPVDFQEGHFLIDDDLRHIAARLPDGAMLTVFADCCHSGSIMRAFVDLPAKASVAMLVDVPVDVRSRYLRMTRNLETSFRAAPERQARGRLRSACAQRPPVTFSACKDFQVAYEYDGHGAFTRAAWPCSPKAWQD